MTACTQTQLLWGHASARDPRAVLRQVGGNLVRQGIPPAIRAEPSNVTTWPPSASLLRCSDTCGLARMFAHLPRVRLRVHGELIFFPQEPGRGRLQLPTGGHRGDPGNTLGPQALGEGGRCLRAQVQHAASLMGQPAGELSTGTLAGRGSRNVHLICSPARPPVWPRPGRAAGCRFACSACWLAAVFQ